MSSSVKAVTASMTGTARMATQGSWRPLMTSSSGSPVENRTVRWGLPMEGVGFTVLP